MIRRIAALAAGLVLMGASAQAQTAPVVKIASGALAGVAADGVVAFKGIPYAAPPVGPLRWKPPQPVAAWKGVRPADKVGALCQQKYNAKDNGVGPLPMSEDCLTLNVFAPPGAKALPVMVWIHGGGFVNGSGTAALYDGSGLARQGVVVVTINYRLGRFGFFAHPGLTAEAKGGPVADYGLMDMIASLKWVQANIKAFGGDPKAVTIFGESAGGIAVNDLMVSPAARGLFIRAIVESGAGREPAPTLAEAEKAGEAFAITAGAPPHATAEDLRKLTAAQILGSADPDINQGFGVVLEGKLMTAAPAAAFARGQEAKVPYVVGFNSLEFPTPPGASRNSSFVKLSDEARAKVKAAYGDDAQYDARLVSDSFFTEPAVTLARAHAAHGLPTWLYEFSVISPSVRSRFQGAVHASERQYVFQTLNTSPWPTDDNDQVQAKTMSAYWTSFAKTGDPNGAGRPTWPRYTRAADQLLDFTNTGPVPEHPPREPVLDALAASYP